MFDIVLFVFALAILCIVTTAPGTPTRAAIWRMIVGALVAGSVIAYAS
jgi:hypothetical protein